MTAPREHTVSAHPVGKLNWRAVCTCGWRSNRFSTMLRAEQAARWHRESVSERPSAGQPAISAPKTTTDSQEAG